MLTEETTDAPQSAQRWNLLVLEDTGELQADARERTGQGLSRFLSVLGHSHARTGHDQRADLLAAPGDRAAAALRRADHFTALAGDEAAAWRASHALPALDRPATLAELYAEATGRTPPASPVGDQVGFR